ncbi:MAG TPA: helix-turn-helix domain-containing protein [Pirellulales bacterium]|jgi:DNA-binding transcriptional regulator YiaG|nr:helix-turn-helix domain-containing protein [Pirellulales bacterium]
MNLAGVLNDEIRRLARKEIRAQMAAIRRASAAQRRDIAQLKRQLKSCERRIAHVVRRLVHGGAPSATIESDAAANRFSARSVRAQRRRLKLSAAEYGKLVGVSSQTIYQWEHGKSRPRTAQLHALVSVRSIGRRAALARLNQPSVGDRPRSPRNSHAEK